MKKASDFIREFVMTSRMRKHDEMWCFKCNNQLFNKIDFKKHMMNIHGEKIFIDIKDMQVKLNCIKTELSLTATYLYLLFLQAIICMKKAMLL